VAYSIVGANFFENLTGTLYVISVIPMFVLLALIPAGLVAAVVDTVRLHRLAPSTRASASYALLDGALDDRPPRHLAVGLSGWLVLGCLVLIPVAYLPRQVDAVAYLAGFGHQDTFIPVSHRQACGQDGCSTVTDGILKETGEDVTWSARVTLGRPFPVRAPVWLTGPGTELVLSASTAAGTTIIGLYFEITAAVMALVAIPQARCRLARLRARITATAAS